ncbi:hypothetical protein Rhopal_005426-T1 [Rhodotorula paludigena]|uniref:CN hydrolase domain-containing protein n=1 Tax=Rhodotorula paludigena TaxID=86838 RepID=A0AAV5GSA7_9BASI|nr:hypothetical protein Rhopal_005426-T1 [Rhodotorula paludigena]
MAAQQLFQSLALVPLAAYALAPATSALSTVVLVAGTSVVIKNGLAPHRRPVARFLGLFLPLLAFLAAGSALSALLTNRAADSFSSAFDAALVALLYSLVSAVLPLVALFVSHLALQHVEPGRDKGYTALLLPAWLFALAGIVHEQAGIGRLGWWVKPFVEVEDGLGWVARLGGQVAVDFAVAAAGIALGEVVCSTVRRSEDGAERRDIRLFDESDTDEHARRQTRRPVRLLLVLLLAIVVAPLLSLTSRPPSHPSPVDPTYTYPPVKVACVVPPTNHDHGRRELLTTLGDWLAETKIVAGRGAKVLSWSESAVRLDKGARRDEGDGWDAMGQQEQRLLRSVADVCDMYKVYVLATYLIPPPSSSRRNKKLLNVATLVGPTTDADEPSVPNLIWSTTKHHPIPLVESYSHVSRQLSAIGSTAASLPLADVALAHAPHTPSPHLTPLQHLSLSGAICQDIAFPSLMSSYALSSTTPSDASSRNPPRTPQLLLSPSLVPPSLPGIAASQLAQARARALEHGAFVLRCDAPSSGSSALVGPHGEVLVRASQAGGSWEAEIRPEQAAARHGGTVLERVAGVEAGEKRWIGAQMRVLLGLLAGLAAVRIVEGGEVARWGREIDSTSARARVRDVWRTTKVLWARLSVRESEEGMGRRGMPSEERLIDVE